MSSTTDVDTADVTDATSATSAAGTSAETAGTGSSTAASESSSTQGVTSDVGSPCRGTCFVPSVIDDKATFVVRTGYFESAVEGDDLVAGQVDGVSIYMNLGGGTFAAPVLYPTQGQVTSLLVSDFNGDENWDVAASTSADEVLFLLGDGLGGFTATSTIGGSGPVDLDRAHIWGQSLAVVTADAGGGTVTVLSAVGDGTFAPSLTVPVGGTPSAIAWDWASPEPWTHLLVADTLAGEVKMVRLLDGALVDIEAHAVGAGPVQLMAQPLDDLVNSAELVVLSNASASVQVFTYQNSTPSDWYENDSAVLGGSPRAFDMGDLGVGFSDLAIVDDVADTVEICALAKGLGYDLVCNGATVVTGPNPTSIAVGRFVDYLGSADIVTGSPTSGITLLMGEDG